MIIKISKLINKITEIKTEESSIIKYKDYMYKSLRNKLNEICKKTLNSNNKLSDNIYLPISKNIIKNKDIIYDTKNKEIKLDNETLIYVLNKRYSNK